MPLYLILTNQNNLYKMNLTVTIKKIFFDLIENGEKKIEYREIKPHWQKKIEGKNITTILFINGYRKDSRRSKYVVTEIIKNEVSGLYEIYLGEKIS